MAREPNLALSPSYFGSQGIEFFFSKPNKGNLLKSLHRGQGINY